MRYEVFVITLCALYNVCHGILRANLSGDVILGGLFPIHRGTDDGQCGDIHEQDGIQSMETAIWTLNQINQVSPNIKIGIVAMDTCESDTVALECALEFVSIDGVHTNRNPSRDGYVCRDGSLPYRNSTSGPVRMDNRAVGVVGAAFSQVSIAVASFLRLFKVPQISYWSTSPELSDSDRFSYFKRTVPSDAFQARAIVNILVRLDWRYVVAIYEQTSYGANLYSEIKRLAESEGICFSLTEKLRPSKAGLAEDLQRIVHQLKRAKNTYGIILLLLWLCIYHCLYVDDRKTSYGHLTMADEDIGDIITGAICGAGDAHSSGTPDLTFGFCEGKIIAIVITHYGLAKSLFEAVNRKSLEDAVYWVGVDAWTGRQFDEAIQGVVGGAIAVQPLARKLVGFDEYFTNLTPVTNTWDPWFREYWQFHFNCKLDDKKTKDVKKDKVCTGEERLSADNGYEQLQSLYYVRDAVLAFYYAIKQIHEATCGIYYKGVCPNMADKLTGQSLLAALDSIEFTDPLGFTFRFVNGTDGPPRYSIMTYRKSNDKYQWQEIGNYTESNGLYRFEMQHMPYNQSVCSDDCPAGQERRILGTRPCCWYCKDCSQNQYVSHAFTCETCAKGFAPNNFRNACYPLPVEFISYQHPVAIVACLFSSVGILLSLFVLVIYIRYRSTPVIKASGIELSFVLLSGVFLSYAATFVFVAKPSAVICGFRRTLLGTCYTICYATILTKTNRIYRIFSMKDTASRLKMKRFTSYRSSLVITILLCAIEIVAIVVWLIFDPPKAVRMDYKSDDVVRNILVCHESMDFSYLGVLLYPFLLMIICIVYAVKTRKTPDGFNETKFITFCSSSTVIIWVAFIPTYFSTNNATLRVTSLTLSLFVNATVILSLLFLRKIYIVLLRPQKNTREKVMSRASLSHDLGDRDISSHYSNVNSRPASAHSLSRQDDTAAKKKNVNGLKVNVSRMHSEGFSVSSPAVGSLGMSLSASEILSVISPKYDATLHTNPQDSSKSVDAVEKSRTTHKEAKINHANNENEIVNIPKIKINDVPLASVSYS